MISAELRHWGLIEPVISERTNARTSGFWTPTDQGIQFTHRNGEVPKYLMMFNNKVISQSSTQTDIVEALGLGYGCLH